MITLIDDISPSNKCVGGIQVSYFNYLLPIQFDAVPGNLKLTRCHKITSCSSRFTRDNNA